MLLYVNHCDFYLYLLVHLILTENLKSGFYDTNLMDGERWGSVREYGQLQSLTAHKFIGLIYRSGLSDFRQWYFIIQQVSLQINSTYDTLPIYCILIIIKSSLTFKIWNIYSNHLVFLVYSIIFPIKFIKYLRHTWWLITFLEDHFIACVFLSIFWFLLNLKNAAHIEEG